MQNRKQLQERASRTVNAVLFSKRLYKGWIIILCHMFHSVYSHLYHLHKLLKLEERNLVLLKICLTLFSKIPLVRYHGLPQWCSGKDSACNACSIPGSGRSPGEGKGNLLQCSCLESPMDREAWWATVHGVTKESDTS